MASPLAAPSQQPLTPHVRVFSISNGTSASDVGHLNAAYLRSKSDLPTEVFISGLDGLQNENNFCLGEASEGEELLEELNDEDVVCLRHTKCLAAEFCIDCLCAACVICQRTHHAGHSRVELSDESSETQGKSQLTSALEDRLDNWKQHLSSYHKQLHSEQQSLERKLSAGLDDIDVEYDDIIKSINKRRKLAKQRLMEQTTSCQEELQEKITLSAGKLAQLDGLDSSADWISAIEAVKPIDMILPNYDVTISVERCDKNEVCSIGVSVEGNSRLAKISHSPSKIDLNLLKTIGSKGSDALEFNLPSGVCIDSESCLYVADEGNNRIQKISRTGKHLGSFTWGQGSHYITDVTYNRVTNQLIVPRAYSKHGCLKCNTFSNVTLDGQEVDRFTVPSMKSGLFLSCSDEGHVIIVDVELMSVFVIWDGEVLLLIKPNPSYLVRPVWAVSGLNGDILVTDSSRCVVVVFDKYGNYQRDICKQKEGADSLKLRKPRGVSVDTSCRVVAVTDWRGDRVLLYSYYGEVLGEVSNFKCPNGVILTDNHNMVVTDCWSSKVKVYKYWTTTC